MAMTGGGWRPNGATRLKRRLLGRAGWRVVSVPHWEWDACAGPAEQAAFLRRLLLPGSAESPHHGLADSAAQALGPTRAGLA